MGIMVVILLIVLVVLLVLLNKKNKQLLKFKPFEKYVDIDAEIKAREKKRDEVDTEIESRKNEYIKRENELNRLLAGIEKYEKVMKQLHVDLEKLEDKSTPYDVGFYQPRYSFDTSDKFRAKLDEVRKLQKQLIDDGKAAIAKITWNVGGNQKEGERISKNIIKLALRAFNGECDSTISKVKFGNVLQYEDKIKKARDTINKLGDKWGIEITEAYLKAILDELHLVYEYQEKVEEEREEQRRIKEQMREEEKAQRELEKARQDAEKEEQRYQDALEKARKELEGKQGKELDELTAKMQELERQLSEAHQRKERALSQAQLTKSGHVYVISNIGSFGENVYKIGMTRRLEPLDRVKELGDASVPFEFDVHAIIYSDNAPEMENQLHKVFNQRRVNMVNEKREFFKVTIDEIENQVLKINPSSEVEFTKVAQAKEYRQTLALLN